MSNETKALELCRELNVSFVVVTFGGNCGYFEDDIENLPQILKASSSDVRNNMALKKTTLFQMSYWNFANVTNDGKQAFDLVRKRTVDGVSGVKLNHFREVFSSRYWLVRIFEIVN